MGGAEKRRYKRVTITSIADMLLVNEKKEFRAYVGGISRGGMEIYTQENLRSGNEIMIRLRFIDASGKEAQEEILAHVRWANKFSDAQVAGLEFSEVISEANYPALLTYLDQAERFFTKE
jgi:c-di-GMP-binding flagellar brake protein YcgR